MTKPFAWHHACFNLPFDWEVVRYSTSARDGRVEWAVEDGPQGQLSWQNCSREPDRTRTLTDAHLNFLKKNAPEKVESFSTLRTTAIGDFKVSFRRKEEPCQALVYLPGENILLMLRFPDYTEEKLEKIWKPILLSYRPNTAAMKAWTIFGLDFRLPKDFALEKADSKPADVWLGFEAPSMLRFDVHRWGLPRELLRRSDLDTFFQRVVRLGHECKVLETHQETWRGMDSVVARIKMRGSHAMDRLFNAHWPGVARIWHNRDEKRLYAYIQAAPKKVALLDETEVFPQ